MSVTLQQTEQARNLGELAIQLKALGDETRLQLLRQVAASRCHDGACICDLTPQTNLAQSTVSHHMKLLVEAGLLARTQRGKWAFYDLTTVGEKLLEALHLVPERTGSCTECSE